MSANESLLRLEGVTKVFVTDEVETHALAGIHMEISRGEYVSISGPSGCGKSTLLAILGLLDTPTDGTFLLNGRPAVYYVRAIQEPTPAVNAAGLRCDRDAEGNCTAVHPCHGDYRTPFDDDCLAPNEERAWSSPIYVQPVS